MDLKGWNLLDKKPICFEIADILAMHRDEGFIDVDTPNGRTPVSLKSVKADN